MIWTDDRCGELDSFRELLWKVSALNSGSGVIQKMIECEQIAKTLLETNYSAPRDSFLNFLEKQAIKERAK